MTRTISAEIAEATLEALLAQVGTGVEVTITRGGQPIAKLVPITRPNGTRCFGAMRGLVRVDPSLFEPLPPEELDAWDQ